MRPLPDRDRLDDLIAFQCVLVALRGVGAESSAEMLLQAFLAALGEQYGFRRLCYVRPREGGFNVVVTCPMDGAPPSPGDPNVPFPIGCEGAPEGLLVLDPGAPLSPARMQQIR